jgi:hypothetical protein
VKHLLIVFGVVFLHSNLGEAGPTPRQENTDTEIAECILKLRVTPVLRGEALRDFIRTEGARLAAEPRPRPTYRIKFNLRLDTYELIQRLSKQIGSNLTWQQTLFGMLSYTLPHLSEPKAEAETRLVIGEHQEEIERQDRYRSGYMQTFLIATQEFQDLYSTTVHDRLPVNQGSRFIHATIYWMEKLLSE